MELAHEHAAAIEAARVGGQVALDLLGEPLGFSWKGQRDLVTEAALEVQAAVFDSLRSAFPDDSLMGEEGPDDEPLPVFAERLWVVDPICGSLNYFQGIPHFSVCVAFRHRGRFQVGVVYDPVRDELFEATLGGGARLNGGPIVVQQVSEGHDAYERAVIGLDLPGDMERRTESLMLTSVLAAESVTVTSMGSPALGLCYVAAGRLHAYAHLRLQLWDVAAAAVIIQEAGGTLTDARGGPWQFSDGGYLATNTIIHGSVLRNMTSVLQRRDPPPVPASPLPTAFTRQPASDG